MKNKIVLAALLTCLMWPVAAGAQQVWTLQDCIDYALENSITLRRSAANVQTSEVNVWESKGVLLPSLSANVSQGMQYRPFQESQGSYVNGDIATSSSNKVTENGSYGVNASWTVWNGGRNRMNIRNNEYSQEIAEYAVETSANTIQEQIAQYYVQILYMREALEVNRKLFENDSITWERGKAMMEQGQMARADVAQLEAQVMSGRYNIVNTQTQIAQFELQLKQVLELAPEDEITVAGMVVDDGKVLTPIPYKLDVYQTALAFRPEIKSAEASIAQSQLAIKQARASYWPSISLTAGLGDSHVLGTGLNWFNQMKQNFNATLGLSISIPIFDNRSTKSAVQRADLSALTAQLDLEDARKELFSTIEGYWLNATSNQQKYLASKSSVASMQASFDLRREQFELGLSNIAELLTARGNLLSAEQDLLQDKYTTLLNLALLKFYQGEVLAL